MLRAQLFFFVPLAIAMIGLAWFGMRDSTLQAYCAVSMAALLASTTVLYVAMRAVTPNDGLIHFPTFAAAYAAPLLGTSVLMRTLLRGWSLPGKIAAALTLSAFAGAVAPVLFLIAACTVQGRCL
ncbi:hypothetical protein ABE85_05120 [Mitsuaria sp. 7]|nr:hypothetical protein ABE85_05120 [Mitsuaria sp. 7]